MKENSKRPALSIFNMEKTFFLPRKSKRVLEAELCMMYALDDGVSHSPTEIAENWLIPRTTVNTIAKRWERAGYLTLVPIPGQRREMRIVLTDEGKEYAKDILSSVYKAENKALQKTLERYSSEFIEALEYYKVCLKDAFAEESEATV